MSKKALAFFAAFVSIIALVGCSPSPSSVLAKHRAVAEAKMAAIAKISSLVSENTHLPKSEFWSLEGPAPSFPPEDESGNAAVLGPEHLGNSTPDIADFRIVFDSPIADAKELLKSGNLANGKQPTGKQVVRAMEQFERLRYLLVIRLSKYVPASGNWTSFTSGRCAGEAQLFDINSGNLVGGFQFQVQNSDEVYVTRQGDAEMGLASNIRFNANKAVRDKLKQMFPAATPAFSEVKF
jgi:hypothetical protein